MMIQTLNCKIKGIYVPILGPKFRNSLFLIDEQKNLNLFLMIGLYTFWRFFLSETNEHIQIEVNLKTKNLVRIGEQK